MYWIQTPLIMLVIFGTIYKVFELFVRREERLLIIKKIEEIRNVDLSRLNLNLNTRNGGKFLALRCGALALGAGLGLFVGQLFAMASHSNWVQDGVCNYMSYGEYSSIFQTACVCFFGGLALVISYIVERITERKDRLKTENNKTEA